MGGRELNEGWRSDFEKGEGGQVGDNQMAKWGETNREKGDLG